MCVQDKRQGLLCICMRLVHIVCYLMALPVAHSGGPEVGRLMNVEEPAE
jgi:hypothetical protein